MVRAGGEGVFIACLSHEVFFATNSVSLPLHPWHIAQQLVRAEYVMDKARSKLLLVQGL